MVINTEDIPFFRALTLEEFASVKKCLLERKFEKNALIHSEGSLCNHLFFVRSGKVKLCRLSPSGDEQTFEILGPGDTCACNPGEKKWTCATTAMALTACEVWLLSRQIYVEMVAGNTKVMNALNHLFAHRMQAFNDLLAFMTLLDSKQRVAKYLLDKLHEKKGLGKNEPTLFIELTREEIAHQLGLTRETVARQISDLRRKKMIEVTPYRIVILKPEALEALLR